VKDAAFPKPFGARHEDTLAALRQLSSRLGRNPLMVQASNGNTSIKLNGMMWIKASGQWLADALHQELFIPIRIAEVHAALQNNSDIAACYTQRNSLRPSVETAMHATLPHRVIVHVHSVNAIAWAIRVDGASKLAERLSGLNWSWIPYAASGLPLAREIDRALASAPQSNIFVLANHGLVVCGEGCGETEELLFEVERRLTISPRDFPRPNGSLSALNTRFPGWQLPDDEFSQALATDEISRRIVSGGVLYPCQAIFLRGALTPLARGSAPSSPNSRQNVESSQPPFVIVENDGVLFNQHASTAQRATLASLAQVTQRTESCAPIRYLSHGEVAQILNQDVHNYAAEPTMTSMKKKSPMLAPSARRNSLLQLRSRPA
jgi:rhamnose utilization protein RhaD (predicted bifunctional aldolase and dehydrogenase)